MNIQDLRARLESDPTPDVLFDLCREVATEIALHGIEVEGVVEAVIRLTDAIDQVARTSGEMPNGVLEMRSALLRHTGLFPYAEPDHLVFRDQLAYEAYRSSADEDIIYHREQLRIIERLEAGRNLILSAPTSFGKSIIIDMLCNSEKRRKVVILVPTLALIDETKRRLYARLGKEVQFIWNEQQVAEPGRRTIYILTQERALARVDLARLDLLVVDEFYKIDAKAEDARTIRLGLAVRRLVQNAKQFFMLGPMITSLLWRSPRIEYEFIQTDFRTVAVDIERISSDGTAEAIASFVAAYALRPALVFCQSPDRAREMCLALAPKLPLREDPQLVSLAEWVRQSFHEEWFAAEAIAKGVGIHTGRIPRALAQLQIHLFDNGLLDILVCTSSIIEGVNTAAKSVAIAGAKIDGSPIQFFTHENIKGRSGRMFRHFVGKVYLFHEPPPPGSKEVDLEYVSGDQVPDSFVAGVDANDSPALVARQQSISATLGLSPPVIREFSPLSIETLQGLVAGVDQRIAQQRFGICWNGIPSFPRLRSTIQLIWEFARPRAYSAPTAASALRLLTIAATRQNVGAFIHEVAQSDNKGVNIGVDIALSFLKVMEYDLPLRLAALEAVIRDRWKDERAQSTNYSAYLAAMSSWFSSGPASLYEEVGVPAQLMEKYAPNSGGRPVSDVVASIRQRLEATPAPTADISRQAERLFVDRVLPLD